MKFACKYSAILFMRAFAIIYFIFEEGKDFLKTGMTGATGATHRVASFLNKY